MYFFLHFPSLDWFNKYILVYRKAHMQLEQKAAQILMYDKSHLETIKRHYHTTYHPHVVVEVSLEFFFHPSLDKVNHLNRAGNVDIL